MGFEPPLFIFIAEAQGQKHRWVGALCPSWLYSIRFVAVHSWHGRSHGWVRGDRHYVHPRNTRRRLALMLALFAAPGVASFGLGSATAWGDGRGWRFAVERESRD
ncbi:hypothetical protein OE88DRAFT_1211126 [Heliocybe sulcata]|uniref:Uncharacterized protein n=1 Tax=Heliocybe sulcata TaxID=5364 RepID=A0A5C3MJG5_9AGAM|nr:hypothetical protein OE88DRAFT_1211126 [Heliocybe sulcata]